MKKLKIVLINMVTILVMPIKMATLDLLKIKLFWNKGYGVIIYLHDVTKKYIADVVIQPKFGNFVISLTEVIITSIL